MFAPKVAKSQTKAPSAGKKASGPALPTLDVESPGRQEREGNTRGPTWEFGRIALHPADPGDGGDALRLAPLGGRFEREAESRAGGLTGGGPGGWRMGAGVGVQAEQETVPVPVHQALRGAGRPLAPDDRRFFEQGFGRDLSHVRLHTGEAAAAGAEAIGALAYTAGSRIVFGRAQYAPGSAAGRGLLAHEVAHVVEHGQTTGGATLVHRAPKKSTTRTLLRSVEVHTIMGSDQLLLEVIKQYRGAATDAQAEALREKEHLGWIGGGTPPTVTKADVDKGYILIPVVDTTIPAADPAKKKERDEQFKGLSGPKQQSINEEADREFWQKTHYKVGQTLTAKGDDQQMGEAWRRVRDSLVDKQAAIDALPPEMQSYLASEDAPASLAPADYETVLRIVSKLAKLSAAELAEYKSRTTAVAADWSGYEAALDRYIKERSEKGDTAKERAQLQTKLYGLEPLYDRYRLYMSMLTTSAMSAGAASLSPESAGLALGSLNAQEKIRAELEADLIKAGLPDGIAGLENLIHRYEANFEKETLALANTMLEQYEHTLWLQQERYRKQAEGQALYQAVSQSAASADYDQADQIRSDHAEVMPMTLEGMNEQGYWVGQRNKALSSGENKMYRVGRGGAAGGGPHPLLENEDFDRQALSRAKSAGDAQAIMLAYIAARQQDVATTRKNLADKPTMIYGLDKLLKASFKALNVDGSPIYGKIIHHHMSDVHFSEAIPKFIVAIIAICAGLLTGGTGAVAVLAAATTLGAGAYQALDSYREYEQGTAAAGAKLLSDSPSFAWVIVALVGAGADLAVLGGTIKAALGAMQPAIETFNAGGKIEKFADDLAELEKLSQIDATMRAKVLKAAVAQAKYRESLKGALGAAMNLNVIFGPGGMHEMASLVYAAAKRGAVAFDQFMLEMKAAKAIDESTMALEDLARFKQLFEEAKTAAADIDTAGKALGLSEDQVAGFLRIWGKTPGMTIGELKVQMTAWEATKQGGVPTMALGKNSMIVDENVVSAMRTQAMKPGDLQPGEIELLKRMESFKGMELRVPQAVGAKGTSFEAFDITVARESEEYKGVMAELDRVKVGGGKGVEDRSIVADAFFAKTEAGVTPTFATHDPGIYKKMYGLTGKDPRLLGKGVAEALPDGFEVTLKVKGVERTIKVMPLPNKPPKP